MHLCLTSWNHWIISNLENSHKFDVINIVVLIRFIKDCKSMLASVTGALSTTYHTCNKTGDQSDVFPIIIQ